MSSWSYLELALVCASSVIILAYGVKRFLRWRNGALIGYSIVPVQVSAVDTRWRVYAIHDKRKRRITDYRGEHPTSQWDSQSGAEDFLRQYIWENEVQCRELPGSLYYNQVGREVEREDLLKLLEVGQLSLPDAGEQSLHGQLAMGEFSHSQTSEQGES